MAEKKGGFSFKGHNQKTFRAKKKWKEHTLKYDLHKRAKASLKAGIDLRHVVVLPAGEDLNDWLAVHVVDFFNRISLIYTTVSEVCTDSECPVMSGGPKYEYWWKDDNQYKKPTQLSAPRYIGLLMDWVDNLVNDEDVFPPSTDVPFPKNFGSTVKQIVKRLFRVFVHVYIHHFDKILSMESEAHINQCYKHFYYFVNEFNLIDSKELSPLKDLTMQMCT